MVTIGQPSKKVVITTPKIKMELDASVTETHSRKAEVTSFPLENGAVLTDHIIFQPIELEIQGIVSRTELRFLASFDQGVSSLTPVSSSFGAAKPIVNGGDPSARDEDAFAFLELLMKQGIICSITTTLTTYANMALLSLSTPRDARRGNMVELNMQWRQLRFAETEAVQTPEPQKPQQAQSSGLGTQQPGQVDQNTSALDESVLSDWSGAGQTPL